jgi:hypothetical protein
MMIDRRTFLLGTALGATIPAAAKLLEWASAVPPHASMMPRLAPGQPDVDPTAMNANLFRIAGWDHCDAIASDHSTAASSDFSARDTGGEPVLISLNQAWRAAWR